MRFVLSGTLRRVGTWQVHVQQVHRRPMSEQVNLTQLETQFLRVSLVDERRRQVCLHSSGFLDIPRHIYFHIPHILRHV
jgi:hypothetical protein